MVLRRLFGPAPRPTERPAGPEPPTGRGPDAETATVRRISRELEALPIDQARYLAGFAYILSRAANADRDISDAEVGLMEQIVHDQGHLSEAQAVLVVEIARNQARLYGGTEDYLVTREFTRMSTLEQRIDLLRCCFLIGAADRSINASESASMNQIAAELQLDNEQLTRVRREFSDYFSAIQAIRGTAPTGEGA